MGGMVPLIVGDRRLRPAKESGNGRLGGACLSIANLMLSLGPNSIGSAKDHDTFVSIREVVHVFACRTSLLGCCLFVVSLLWPTDLSEETFEELTLLVEVFDRVGVVGGMDRP